MVRVNNKGKFNKEFYPGRNLCLVEIQVGPSLLASFKPHLSLFLLIVKLGSRSKVYLKSLIRDLDLELVAIIAMSPPPTHP